MTDATVGDHIVEEMAKALRERPFISDATEAENDMGPYVEVTVPDGVSRDKLYDEIDQYPCYVDVVVGCA